MSHEKNEQFYEAVYEMNSELIQGLMKRNAELTQTIALMKVEVPSVEKALDILHAALGEEGCRIDQAHDNGDVSTMRVLVNDLSENLDTLKAMYDSACEDYRMKVKFMERLQDEKKSNYKEDL